MEEKLILVDENDSPVGVGEKLAVHQQALCHRAFSIFVVRKEPQDFAVLLQQRHPQKYHCGGMWTNTCCGHPRPEEATVAAGQRRLKEEFGFEVSLKEIGVFHYIARFDNGLTENEVDHVLLGVYDNQPIDPHPQEIAAYRWASFSEIDAAMKDEKFFTPWFYQAYEFVRRTLKSEER